MIKFSKTEQTETCSRMADAEIDGKVIVVIKLNGLCNCKLNL